MNKVIVTAVIIFLFSSIACSGSTNVPPGSFVKQRADSVNQLVKQILTDKVVGQRYEKHFGMSAKKLANYFKTNLNMVCFIKPLRATVWYVNKKGGVYTKTKLLPVGTVIFIDKKCKPVLIWSCGNPLVKKIILPKDIVKKEPLVDKDKPVNNVTQELLAPSVEPKVLLGETNIPKTIEEIITPVEVVIPPIAIVPTVEEVIIPEIAVNHTSPLTGYLFLGTITGVVFIDGHRHRQNDQVVPEPSSFIALAYGFTMLGLYYKKSTSITKK